MSGAKRVQDKEVRKRRQKRGGARGGDFSVGWGRADVREGGIGYSGKKKKMGGKRETSKP